MSQVDMRSIAVLGGGLSGLSAAFHIARRFPTTPIAVVNSDPRFGGWVRSESVTLSDHRVLLEAGPRSLRPNARSVLELIHLLGLSSSLVTVPKSAPAAKNRFLYIPGSQLLCIPSSPLQLVRSLWASNSRLGRLLVSSVLQEPLRRRNRPPSTDDESVDDFLTRRFGADFARVFGSALVHGIYAADARKLSLGSAFPSLWDAEERGRGSVLLGLLRAPGPNEDSSYDLGGLQDMMRHVSVYTFQDGMATLVNALVDYLHKQPNVRMYSGVRVLGLRLNPRNDQFEVTTSSQKSLFPTHIVSALPLPELRKVLLPPTQLPHLTTNTYSSVTVLNLVFALPPSSSRPLHPDGFGYLVPRPTDGYTTTNGSGILGCVFDSSSAAVQDSPGTVKMTVMLGGPYASNPTQVDVPTVLSELGSQLGFGPLPPPLFVKVHSNARCIPLYTVGHLQRMEELKTVLASEPINGRMEVIGAGVGGVSVGDCVEAGRNVGTAWS